MTAIDTTETRSWLEGLKGFSRKAWQATSFCRARKEDGSWHETSKISVQRGTYGSMAPADAELAAAAPRLHGTALKLCNELDAARAEIARLQAELQARPAAPAPLGDMDPAALSARLKAAGLPTIEEMLEAKSEISHNAGSMDLDAHEAWLEGKCREFLAMRSLYDLGERDLRDEFHSWVVAHAAAWRDALLNFRLARETEREHEADLRKVAAAYAGSRS